MLLVVAQDYVFIAAIFFNQPASNDRAIIEVRKYREHGIIDWQDLSDPSLLDSINELLVILALVAPLQQMCVLRGIPFHLERIDHVFAWKKDMN